MSEEHEIIISRIKFIPKGGIFELDMEEMRSSLFQRRDALEYSNVLLTSRQRDMLLKKLDEERREQRENAIEVARNIRMQQDISSRAKKNLFQTEV